MLRELLLLVWLAAGAAAQSDSNELLLRTRDKVLHTLNRLPRYMCTQTVDRSQYEPDRYAYVKDCEDLELGRDTRWKLLQTTADRLRLDVAVASQREIYSWVGENQFGNRSLFDIVNQGSLSSGYFQGFLELVFRSDNADFSYAGEVSEGGRKLIEYLYRVPLESSHYTFSARGHAATTAYEGTVLTDPDTAELVRLTVRTSHLPSETGACEATTILNYSPFHLNGADFLLPSETRLHIKNLNGVESENWTVYSACHEFLGESTLKFDTTPDPAPEKAAASLAAAAIPAGLWFGVALAEDIQVARAAAGETVKAVLTTDLRNRAKKVLVPKGTPALCRIVRISRYYHGKDSRVIGMLVPLHVVELVLRLEGFMLPGGRRPIFARVDTGVRGAASRSPRTLGTRPAELGPLNSMEQNQWFTRFNGVADDYVIRSGMAAFWETVAQ